MVAIPYHNKFNPPPAPLKMEKIKRPPKAKNIPVTPQLLEKRVAFIQGLGYTKQKWVEFCETMLARGFSIYLYEARETVSKYVTVTDGYQEFKVRFSNHKPNKGRELNGDCDFFVGHTHTGIRTTGQAVIATFNFFKNSKNKTCNVL